MLRGGRRSAGAILRLGSEGPDRASVRPGNAGRTPQLAGRGSSLSTSLGPRHSVPPMDGVPADEMSACQGGRTSSSGQGGLSSALCIRRRGQKCPLSLERPRHRIGGTGSRQRPVRKRREDAAAHRAWLVHPRESRTEALGPSDGWGASR